MGLFPAMTATGTFNTLFLGSWKIKWVKVMWAFILIIHGFTLLNYSLSFSWTPTLMSDWFVCLYTWMFCKVTKLWIEEWSEATCVSYSVWVELDGRWVFAAADAAVSFHFAAEELPPPVQLRVCPVALGLCRRDDHMSLETLLTLFSVDSNEKASLGSRFTFRGSELHLSFQEHRIPPSGQSRRLGVLFPKHLTCTQTHRPPVRWPEYFCWHHVISLLLLARIKR